MKIAIVGYGAMGHEVEKIAKLRNIDIKAIIDHNLSDSAFKEVNEDSLKDVDVCIDFTEPHSVLENIKKYINLGKKIVIGTTGWYDHINEVKEMIMSNNSTLIYAPNFSIGVNLFYIMIEESAKLFNAIPDYDIASYEIHHNHKKDSPSGTAEIIGKILLNNINRKNKVVYDRLNRKIEPNEIHVASVRCGEVPGTHVVCFDSSCDTIELKHTARNRSGLALGAMMAAEWIQDKRGVFTIQDMIKDLITNKNDNLR